MNLNELNVHELLSGLRSSQYSCSDLIESCLNRIDEVEPRIRAWAHLDRSGLLDQSRQADTRQRDGRDGPLNGIPIGVKDIFDTMDMPTENGTRAHKGRQPEQDAVAVDLLRQAGAVIAGKTVTAELAVYTPGKTTNPHDQGRTPGGSSSGSAAAVASGMVPLAIGTQTNGSVIRPASYCGVVGYKPTFGMIPRQGILRQSPSLDQVGVFSRTVADSALLASVLTNHARPYGDTYPWPLLDPAAIASGSQNRPHLAFARTAVWSDAEPEARERLVAYMERLDMEITEIILPREADKAVACHRTIMLTEMAHNYRDLYQNQSNLLSPKLREMLEEGKSIPLFQYLEAKMIAADITAATDDAIAGFDGVFCLATPGVAPVGLEATGSPIFSTLWSLCGTPAITLPVLSGASGMPLGLQIVGARGQDNKLLKTARWIETEEFTPISGYQEEYK